MKILKRGLFNCSIMYNGGYGQQRETFGDNVPCKGKRDETRNNIVRKYLFARSLKDRKNVKRLPDTNGCYFCDFLGRRPQRAANAVGRPPEDKPRRIGAVNEVLLLRPLGRALSPER